MYDKDQQFGALAPYSLIDKTAVVTGAASGIGKATARLFASVGARVVVADLNTDGAESVARDIVAAGGKAIGVRCDISKEDEVNAAFGKVADVFGTIDVLVNNAAYRGKAEFLEVTVDQWDLMFAVITRGTFLCMRAAIRQMREAGHGGSIVNISSAGSAHTTVLANAHYDAAKAGVDSLTRSAAVEFAADRIRVNSILPGPVQTEGVAKILSSIKWRGPLSQPDRMMFGFAQPIELAHAILFLASPAASNMTGHCMVVDGGFLVS